MKINIRFIDGDTRKTLTIRAFLPFEMYGKTFAVHRKYNVDGTPQKYGYAVTETSTGFVCCFGMTRAEAIQKTKNALNLMGEERFYQNYNHMVKQEGLCLTN